MGQLNQSDIENIEFWRSLNPDLNITSRPFTNNDHIYQLDQEMQSRLRQQIVEEGYFQTPKILNGEEISVLHDAVISLNGENIMPLFAAIYDEFWILLRSLRKTFTSFLHDAGLARLARALPPHKLLALPPASRPVHLDGEAGVAPVADTLSRRATVDRHLEPTKPTDGGQQGVVGDMAVAGLHALDLEVGQPHPQLLARPSTIDRDKTGANRIDPSQDYLVALIAKQEVGVYHDGPARVVKRVFCGCYRGNRGAQKQNE